MGEENKIDPKHGKSRTILRTLGPTITGIGLLFLVIGMGSFFSSFGSSEPPRYFWGVFLGVSMCMFGFLGSFARYVSGEAAPVQKDTFNYLAEGTKEGVKTIATAIGQGVAAGNTA